MNYTIKVTNLSKRFADTIALNQCSFQLEKGEVFGYLGPSGAGKTTTIKLLSGQLQSDEGTIEIMGSDPFNLEIREKIGIMSDNSGLYEKLSVYDNLKIFTDIYKLPPSRIDEVLESVELLEERKKKVQKLSRGMRQRLIFARTILNNPEILFLDEPTANLDPATAEEVRNLIRQMKRRGTTVFLTTHNMEEADEICDRVAFLNKGQIIETGTPEQLKLKYAKRQVKITTSNGVKVLPLNKDHISQYLLMEARDLIKIHSVEPTLKEVFLALTEGGK